MTENQRKSLRTLGVFGWAILLFGLILLVKDHFVYIWEWGLMALALIFIYNTTFRNERQNIFPGMILFITSGGFLLRSMGYIAFPIWHFWPLLFFSIGVGFLFLWILQESGWWVLYPGGLFIIAGSGALSDITWFKYQHFLRGIANQWIWLLTGFVLILIWDYLTSKKESDPEGEDKLVDETLDP